jgi:hypothetical protein
MRRNTAVMLTGITLGLITLWSIGHQRRISMVAPTTTYQRQAPMPTIQPPAPERVPLKPVTGQENFHGLMITWCRYDFETRLKRPPSEMDLRKCAIKEAIRIDEAARKRR